MEKFQNVCTLFIYLFVCAHCIWLGVVGAAIVTSAAVVKCETRVAFMEYFNYFTSFLSSHIGQCLPYRR